MVWPEGKENLSGGRTLDQQCGSIWQGRGRWLRRLSALKTMTPTMAARAAELTAAKRCGPPKRRRRIAVEYQIQPSPRRVAVRIPHANPRGAAPRVSSRT